MVILGLFAVVPLLDRAQIADDSGINFAGRSLGFDGAHKVG